VLLLLRFGRVVVLATVITAEDEVSSPCDVWQIPSHVASGMATAAATVLPVIPG
jgi:hypothetical protein